MLKYISIILFLFSSITYSMTNFDMSYVSKVPILHDGRIKNLDTFARTNLLLIHGKSKLKDMSAISWMIELLFDPNKSYKKRVFSIKNIDVLKALSLEKDKSNNYTFIEVSTAINAESKLVSEISKLDRKLRSPSQQQIYELYYKVSKIFELSRSLSLIIPQFQIPTKQYADKLKLPFSKRLTYLQVLKRKPIFENIAGKIFEHQNNISDDENSLLALGRSLEVIASDTYTQIFRVVPPQVGESKDGEWHSPWQTVQGGYGNPLTVKLFEKWSDIYVSYINSDLDAWEETTSSLLYNSEELAKSIVSSRILEMEYQYNNWDLFTKTLSFYILSFLLLCFSWVFWKEKLKLISFASLGVGSVMHATGLIYRCIIMNRPPVSTLYESIVFVALITVLGAIYIESKRKDGLGTFIGTLLGSMLIFVSFGYEKSGDSMGMLAAVLDTNFWLATHVVTITIGYGCSFVSSILGHIYLVQKFITLKDKEVTFDSRETLQNMHGAVLFALFFTVLGTILVGIWADQSWGRFWGWDPKENGAMLICMWLLWSVHGDLTKYFKDSEYALAVSLTSIVVVLAWFGVNLLNVGLHSYGFTESIANNIAYFTIAELVFCFTCYFMIKRRISSSKAVA